MKLLTLNTHSIIEEDYKNKLAYLAEVISEIKPDVIALQEVSQTSSLPVLDSNSRYGVVSMRKDIPLKADNYAVNLCQILFENNAHYNCLWLPIKRGYENLDEGVAILSRGNVCDADVVNLSQNDDYNSWKTRKGLGIKLSDNTWYYSLHFGWWDDAAEPFLKQWHKFTESVYGKRVWAMGDFNSPDNIRDEGYDLVTTSGWYDSFLTAKEHDSGITVDKTIAGWREGDRKRIDYIFSNYKEDVIRSEVIFNGTNKEVVSDHFGVLVSY